MLSVLWQKLTESLVYYFVMWLWLFFASVYVPVNALPFIIQYYGWSAATSIKQQRQSVSSFPSCCHFITEHRLYSLFYIVRSCFTVSMKRVFPLGRRLSFTLILESFALIQINSILFLLTVIYFVSCCSASFFCSLSLSLHLFSSHQRKSFTPLIYLEF